MFTLYAVTDPEAATYALDSAACLVCSLASCNFAQAALDAISLAGWVHLAIA
jgi:hypothetical protein